jgi:hypothetical protein
MTVESVPASRKPKTNSVTAKLPDRPERSVGPVRAHARQRRQRRAPRPDPSLMIEDRDCGPQVTWHDEPVPITVERGLRPNSSIPKEQEQAFVGRECDQWPREMLAAAPVLHARPMSVGREAGFTVDGLRRAKERIGVTAYRDGFGPGSRVYWKPNSASIHDS